MKARQSLPMTVMFVALVAAIVLCSNVCDAASGLLDSKDLKAHAMGSPFPPAKTPIERRSARTDVLDESISNAMSLADFLKETSNKGAENLITTKKMQAARSRREMEGAMCMDDEFENNNSFENATLITDVPSDAELKFCPEDAEDFYMFSDICVGGRLHITLRHNSSIGDIDIYIFSDPATLIASSRSTNDVEEVFVRGGGTYFLRVDNFGEAEISYTIDYTVDCTPCADDEFEPNSRTSDATLIGSVSPESEFKICAGDSDYFALDVCPGGLIDFQIFFDHAGGADLDMALLTSSLSVLARSTSSTDNERLRGRLNGGRYFMLVLGKRANDENSYTVSYSVDCPCADDDFEENNSRATATPAASIMPNTPLQACSRDPDWYVFDDLCEGGELVVEVHFAHANGNLDAALLNSTGIVTFSESMDDGERLSAVATGSDPLYLLVAGTDGAENSYTFSYTVTCPCTNDAFENNNHPNRATPIDDITPETQLHICENDVDVFVLDVCEGGVFEVTMSFNSSEGNLEMALIDENFASVAGTRVGPSSTNSEYLRFTRGGLYYLGIPYLGNELSYTLNYTVDCNPGPDVCIDDDFEFNNFLGNAAPVTSIMPDTQLQVCANDNDVYLFDDICEGGELVVDVHFTHANGNLDAALLDSNGDLLSFSGTMDDGERVSAVSPAGDPLYLIVGSDVDGVENSYTLSYNISCPPCSGVNPIKFKRRCRRKCNGFFNYFFDAEEAGFIGCHKPHCECVPNPCEGADIVKKERICRRRCKGFYEYVDADEAGFPGCNKKVCNCLPNLCAGTNPVRKEKFCRRKCNNFYVYFRNAENAGFVGCNRRHCECL